MELFPIEAILCVSHVTFNERIMFCYLNYVLANSNICPRTEHIHCSLNGVHPDGDPSGSLLKE